MTIAIDANRDPRTVVYIIIINWNSWQHTIECLESVYRSDYRHFQVIVVDNGSTDDSLSHITKWANHDICVMSSPDNVLAKYFHPPLELRIPVVRYSRQVAEQGGSSELENLASVRLPDNVAYPLILVDTQENLGFGSGNNVALRMIEARGDGDFIWLLNNDTVIEPTTLSQMIASASQGPSIVGSVVMHYQDWQRIQSFGGGFINPITGRSTTAERPLSHPVDFITGASLMLDQKTLKVVGHFDENIFMYFEDVDICLRAKKQGFPILVSPAKVYHKGGASSSNSYFQWISVYRNKIYVLKKHYGLGSWAIGSMLMWMANLIHPKADKNKKQASREAFQLIYEMIRNEISK